MFLAAITHRSFCNIWYAKRKSEKGKYSCIKTNGKVKSFCLAPTSTFLQKLAVNRQQTKVGIIVKIAMPGCGFGKVHLFSPTLVHLALYSGVHIGLDEADFRSKRSLLHR